MVRLYSLQRDFINNFTHELKTPATSLKLYLETFLKHDLPREEQQKFLGYMLKDVNRITETIGSILNLARIETRTYSAELETVDLVETVARFYEQGGHLFPKGGIQIHNPSGAVYPSSINPVLFDMLLMNLTANAFKYNESDRPSLDIFFEKEKNRYRIRFEDNGIGIPKGEHKNIFKKFYQVDTGDSGSAKGSGLGLYLVHQIARIHGGEVTATDRKDVRGAVFVLHLPGCRTKPKTGGQG
jgi:signal transduction histidine kinase